ncbi:TonB-dependent siderophore receptor [Methylobacterium segetis]|uniref:TonB-dependent siderophore receptor n=1 Tax=Methylobacterium segetis TaxID=2488750 RepID=UPI00104E4BC1|nr:TonB-dependent siderophore receptor [Methylobacterium segetis]
MSIRHAHPTLSTRRRHRALAGASLAVLALVGGGAAAQEATQPRRGAANPTAAGASAQLEELSVEGAGNGRGVGLPEDPRGPINGYVANRSTAGTKTNTPILETPQAITVIGRQQLDDQKPVSLQEALQYSPVLGATFGSDTRNDWFLIRGFPAQEVGLFLDGLQLFETNYATWKLEPFGLERIEVLRGPSSVLYGGTGPSGIVNAVSKRPPLVPLRYVEAGVNEFGNAYGAFDIGGPVATTEGQGQFFYRVVGRARGGGTQVDYTNDDSFYIAPSLTWRPDASTSFTVLSSFRHDDTKGQNFLPYVGTVQRAPFGFISTSRFTGDPGIDKFTRDQALIGYEFEHRFDNDIVVRQNARYGQVDVDYRTRFGGGYATTPAAADLSRFNFLAQNSATQADLDTQVIAPFRTGFLDHTLLGGVEYRRYDINNLQDFGFGPSLNLINPVYTPNAPFTTGPFQNNFLTQNQVGLYLQDQIKFGPWTLVLSGRHDWVNTDNDNRLGPSGNRDISAFSGRVGLIYTSDLGVAPYVSYARSFNPIVGTNGVTGEILRPETGEQVEVGFKYQPIGFDGYVGAAVFDLTRQNVLSTNPANVLQTIQNGEVRSRGVELEAVANLMPGLRLVGAYTAYQFQITRDADPTIIGRTPAATPQQFGSIFLDYTIQTGAWRNFGFGGGVRGVGGSYADPQNLFKVSPYIVGDAVIHYDWEGWRFALNVRNISDERYVSTCSTVSACFYGDRRRILASVGYKW